MRSMRVSATALFIVMFAGVSYVHAHGAAQLTASPSPAKKGTPVHLSAHLPGRIGPNTCMLFFERLEDAATHEPVAPGTPGAEWHVLPGGVVAMAPSGDGHAMIETDAYPVGEFAARVKIGCPNPDEIVASTTFSVVAQ